MTKVFSEPGSHNLAETYLSLRSQLPRDLYRRFYTSDIDDPGLELRPILSTLRVPTLVLHGEEDCIAPLEGGRYMAEHIPDARFYTFKGREHGLLWTATGSLSRLSESSFRPAGYHKGWGWLKKTFDAASAGEVFS